MLKSVTLEIVGDQKIHCEGCEERIARLLKSVTGVRQVRPSARTQRIEVLFDAAALQPAAIVEKLRESGYEATAGG